MKKSKENIYKKADKAGKIIRKYGGYVVTGMTMIALNKAPDVIRKLKK